jgi:spore coat protein U-like protein
VIVRGLLLAFCLCAALLVARPAFALTCSAAIDDVDFGPSVNMLSGMEVDTTADLTVSCSNFDVIPLVPLPAPARACIHLGNGSGGADGQGRKMIGPSGVVLHYQLYTDAARTTVWGDGTFGSAPNFDLSQGNPTQTLTIYARIFAAQSTVPVGSYASNFLTSSDVDVQYGTNDIVGLVSCDGIVPLLTQHAATTFTVQGTIGPNCMVSTTGIDFGSYGVLDAERSAPGSVIVTCTNAAGYFVGLGNGQNGTAPAARQMKKASGSEMITYGLYTDTGVLWGDSGGERVSATGTGTAQSISVIGKVPPQDTPPPGLYKDTVVVTITY